MQWVFIDSSVRGRVRFGFIGDREQVKHIETRTEGLLPALSRLGLPAMRRADGVCVVAGPGSFSSIRSGVLIANLLSRLLGKKLVGVSVADAADLVGLSQRLAASAFPASSFVAPIYDAEPNITKPKVV